MDSFEEPSLEEHAASKPTLYEEWVRFLTDDRNFYEFLKLVHFIKNEKVDAEHASAILFASENILRDHMSRIERSVLRVLVKIGSCLGVTDELHCAPFSNERMYRCILREILRIRKYARMQCASLGCVTVKDEHGWVDVFSETETSST